MISKEYDKKDSLNFLIYEYLLKNNFKKTAEMFQEETGISLSNLNDSKPALRRWYDIFIETAETRSGLGNAPDALDRIEGIMMRLENEKRRHSRIRSIINKPPPAVRRTEPYSGSSSPIIHPKTHSIMQHSPQIPAQIPAQVPALLKEIKKIDLGIAPLISSVFCPVKNVLVVYSSDLQFHFYNLATNMIEFDFCIGPRPLKYFKVRENKEIIYIAYATDEFSIRLCKYEHMKKEDVKVFDFDTAFKSFCLSSDTLYVLEDGYIKSFTFLGMSTGKSKASHVLSIECAGNKLLIADSTKVSEYDIRLNVELNILARCRFPVMKVKNDEIFLVLNDSIQVFDAKIGNLLSSVNSTLPCKDVALLFNTIAVCTSTDLFYGTDIVQVENPMEMSTFSCFDVKGLIVVSFDGIVTLYSRN